MREFAALLATLPILTFTGVQPGSPPREPIIDVHMHGGPSINPDRFPPRAGESADEAFLRAALAEFDKYNVVLALTGITGPERYAATWRNAAPGRIVVGPQLSWRGSWPDTDWLKQEYATGRMGLLGEVGYVYVGLPPTHPRLAPYFALAEKYDVPVGVHTGRRPRSSLPDGCCPDFNDDYGDPALLKEILARHPRLRLFLMHVGGREPNRPYLDSAIALMKANPNVYADMSVVAIRAGTGFHDNLRRMITEGVLSRIMFGSDGAPFISSHVEAFESVPFLTNEQKRDIFYNNAARFLRLSSDEIARHYGR
jgi:hypothetical protein